MRYVLVAILFVFPAVCQGFSTPAAEISAAVGNEIFEFLKWGGSEPDFDVVEMTKNYVESFSGGGKDPPGPEWYHKDYLLRGPVIGPIGLSDLRATQSAFNYNVAFPDLTIETFGYTLDPENPYRCFYFQRWRGTHTGTLTPPGGGGDYEATGNQMECPVSTFSVVWTPDRNIIYEQVGSPVDRFEGNTEGKAAVFGLLHTAGLNLPGFPGSTVLRVAQRLGHLLKSGRSYSEEAQIPAWWTSKSRGADLNDPS